MLVKDVLDIYKVEENFVVNSMINKSFDDKGCTYKWLCLCHHSGALRREVFIATSTTEEDLLDRTAIHHVEIGEAI